MFVLYDTNVILDLLLLRQPFAPAATRLVASVEQGRLSGMLAATSVTTIDYLLAKSLGLLGVAVVVIALLLSGVAFTVESLAGEFGYTPE